MDLISYSFSVTTVGARLFQAVLGYVALILVSADLIELADVIIRKWRWTYRQKQLEAVASAKDLYRRRYQEADEFDIIDKRKHKGRQILGNKLDSITPLDQKDYYINHFSTIERIDSEVCKVRFLEANLNKLRRN